MRRDRHHAPARDRIINSVLLAPLPFAHQERLITVQETFPVPGAQTGTGSVSYANYLDWKAESKSLDFAISSYASSANLVGNGDPERISIAGVGADVFPILGVKPTVGRTFAAGRGCGEWSAAHDPQRVVLAAPIQSGSLDHRQTDRARPHPDHRHRSVARRRDLSVALGPD